MKGAQRKKVEALAKVLLFVCNYWQQLLFCIVNTRRQRTGNYVYWVILHFTAYVQCQKVV